MQLSVSSNDVVLYGLWYIHGFETNASIKRTNQLYLVSDDKKNEISFNVYTTYTANARRKKAEVSATTWFPYLHLANN